MMWLPAWMKMINCKVVHGRFRAKSILGYYFYPAYYISKSMTVEVGVDLSHDQLETLYKKIMKAIKKGKYDEYYDAEGWRCIEIKDLILDFTFTPSGVRKREYEILPLIYKGGFYGITRHF